MQLKFYLMTQVLEQQIHPKKDIGKFSFNPLIKALMSTTFPGVVTHMAPQGVTPRKPLETCSPYKGTFGQRKASL